jgi:hypothetical protein
MTRTEQAAVLRFRRDPYRTLVAAILHQAVQDATARVSGWTDGGRDSRCTRLAARRYLGGCADLTTLCELVDCDGPTILRALRKAAGLPEAA